MKFLADENVEKLVVDWLRDEGFDVLYIAEVSPSVTDEEIIRISYDEQRVIITNDKGFGELIFYRKEPVVGLILIRAKDEGATNKVELIREVIGKLRDRITGHFIVVNEIGIRTKSLG